MEKQESIFRQKSVERVSSPEQLDDYLKVTSPSVWLVLVGIIILLVGTIAWGAFGKLKTYAVTGCYVEDGVNGMTILERVSDQASVTCVRLDIALSISQWSNSSY